MFSRRWTLEDEAFLKENYGKYTAEQLTELLNRSMDSIRLRATLLGLREKQCAAWTAGELAALREMWGVCSVRAIAKKLKRTECAVVTKAERLKLGPSKEAEGLITYSQLAAALCVSNTLVQTWIRNRGLKHKKKVTKNSKRFYLIDLDDFWSWAETNQKYLNFSRFEPLALGAEPKWVKDKRNTDRRKIRNRMRWTVEEEKELKKLLTTKPYLTRRQIGKKLKRSTDAISCKVLRTNVW